MKFKTLGYKITLTIEKALRRAYTPPRGYYLMLKVIFAVRYSHVGS